MCYVRNFPWLRTSNVSALMLKAGCEFQVFPFRSSRLSPHPDAEGSADATVYEQANAVHAGRLTEFHRLEDAAKKAQRGMWAGGKDSRPESPAEFKKRMRKETE